MLEYISDLRLFCEICHTLNFRAAGEKLGYSPAVVSMRVKRLEAVTGKTLFLRTTRHIALTEEGRALEALAMKALDLAELMTDRRKQGEKLAVSGTVRITAPHSFARLFLLQPIQELQEQHPQLSIDLQLADSITPLVKEGIDISFRIGGQDEASMNTQDLFLDTRIVVASPEYLERFGEPQSPDDLISHRCLSYSNMKHWLLYKNGEQHRVTLPRALYCNTGDYLAKLAVNGAGITVKSDWSISEELQAGLLVRVLPEYTLGVDQTIKILTQKRDVTPMRVQCVFDTIHNHIISEVSQQKLTLTSSA